MIFSFSIASFFLKNLAKFLVILLLTGEFLLLITGELELESLSILISVFELSREYKFCVDLGNLDFVSLIPLFSLENVFYSSYIYYIYIYIYIFIS